MKRFRVIAKFERTVAIVDAVDTEDAEEKYWDGEIVEWEEEAQQADIDVREVK